MDEIFQASRLETVQFISIFSYLNTLSDFLFIENYLAEDDQTKQIPIVNGLYQYFEDHRNNQSMQLKLIRSLLKGSDLYGEEDNENLDVLFVNAMFDHIISSLVFDKFENIYGFIAHVVHKADNFQIDSICEQIKSTLQNATFENEYGDPSTLTSTAADRIFSDIILPLFPQPKTNLTLYSIDYIYAQAGSIILRSARINTTYYTDNKTYNVAILDEEHLFDEYLITGHTLDYLLIKTDIDRSNVKAFALPAVCYYVFRHKFVLSNKNISDLVTNPKYLNEAYEYLFAYFDEIKTIINNQLKEDYTYEMHLAFSNFYTNDIIHNFTLDEYCHQYVEDFNKANIVCQDRARMLTSHIEKISETYKKYDLKAVQDSFGRSLMKALGYSEVVVNLIVLADQEKNMFNESKPLSYDLLQIYFPLNNTIQYYALIRANYTVTLIKETDNITLFEQKLGLPVEELLNHGIPIILKFANESIDKFPKNLIEYKVKRLQKYLQFSVKYQSSNVKWWKEFGLSLIPAYQNLSNTATKNYYNQDYQDEINIILLLDKFGEDISSQLTQDNTRSFLALLGTTFRLLNVWVLNDLISKTMTKEKHSYTRQNENITINYLKELCFHTEVPGFDVTTLSQEYITLLLSIIDALKEIINSSFIYVKSILNNIQKLQFNFRMITDISKNKTYVLYVKTQNTTSDTGYGYKFISTRGLIAQLRTGYELKEKILVSLLGSAQTGEKMYIKINNVTLVHENNNYVYEIDNQLRKNNTRLLFSKIPIHRYIDVKCNIEKYLTGPIRFIDCPRIIRKREKDRRIMKALDLAFNKSNLSLYHIQTTIKKYLFPDDSELESTFVKDWINSTNLQVPKWSEDYIIDIPELFLKLRYDIFLEDPNLSAFNGRSRIELIYNKKERHSIEKGISIDEIVKNYNDQKAQYSVTFEDYYAIRNFATTGFTRITGDTNEAKYMKSALYKLAIRQSDDLASEFYRRLFKVVARPIDIINTTLFNIGKTFSLTKFTLTSVSKFSAIKLTTKAGPGFKNILYEMKFSGRHFRGQIMQSYKDSELKAILLPGSEFEITTVTETQIEGLGGCLEVKLQFIHKSNEKYAWYKKIMSEISRINF